MSKLLCTLIFSCIFSALASTQNSPHLGIEIAPIFNGSAVAFLQTTLDIQGFNVKAKDSLVYFDISRSYWTSQQRYDSEALRAVDASGDLPIIYVDNKEGQRVWMPLRDTVGNISVKFSAEPRGDNPEANVAGRNDLRFDQGGVFGQAASFIPSPASNDSWTMSLVWSLPENSPSDTHFTSSWGDASPSYASGLLMQVLHSTVFAIGQLRRWPSWEEVQNPSNGVPGHDNAQFGMYWIGDLPWDTEQLGSQTKSLYNGTASYFGDLTSDFRVFIRRDFSQFGGIGGYKSYLLEYSPGSEIEQPFPRLTNLVSHEIIHDFALTSPAEDYDKWYVEGIAEYLAPIGPYSGGTLDRDTFIKWLNDNAQDYYTSSPHGRTWQSLITNYWTQGTAVVKAPYTRGPMYLAYVQGLISAATNDTKSIDDVILALYRMYQDEKEVRTEQFLSEVSQYIGTEASQSSFALFSNGTLLVPSEAGFARYGLKMVRRDKERFQLGFAEGSLGTGTITGLIAGSRAEKVGLVEGDQVVSAWGVWGASDTFESMMRVVVERNGTQTEFEWRPRSEEKVECWEWIEDAAVRL